MFCNLEHVASPTQALHEHFMRAVRASIEDVADHIEHIRGVAGIDHVGIGSDFWGMPDMPIGLEDASKFPDLFAVLIQRGWSDEDLRKLAGENLLRVMHRVEVVAHELRQRTAPSNLAISELDKPK